MNVLTNKTAKTSKYFSRYGGLYYYYNKLDKKEQLSTTKWLSQDNTYKTHIVKKGDTFDTIALYYYNNPTYYWIICDFNRIIDPFTKLKVGDVLYIPTLGSKFKFED